MSFFEPIISNINNNGSLIGLILLFYGNAVSGFSYRRMKSIPHDLSGVERSFFGTITTTISGPTNIWVIVYLIAILGVWKGLLVWFIAGISILIILKFLFLNTIIGIHMILAFIALITGTILTILRNPF
jgi:hypothetical protein